MAQQSYLSGRDDSRRPVETAGPPLWDGILRKSLEDLLRLWWLVLMVVVLALVAGFFVTLQTPTTYTSRSSLIVNSNNRSPDQDAVLVQGYVTYFNDAAYQSQLAEQAGVSEPVSLVARAAASSPILVVESTAASPGVAQSSVVAVAEAFRDDINRVAEREQADKIQDLQGRLDKVLEAGGANTSVAATLQDQIAMEQDDRTNRLQDLQLRGGVSQNTPSLTSTLGLAGFSGVVGGVFLALLVGLLSPRRRRARLRSR